jgi:hypothetical protein
LKSEITPLTIIANIKEQDVKNETIIKKQLKSPSKSSIDGAVF